MPLTIGSRLASYEVLALLGAGGMGEVYRARDHKLGRNVAIKALPSAFTADPDRLARFEREARMLAALNHPNIATIHGLEEAGDVRALVMELVEGETLTSRIARSKGSRPLRLAEALGIGQQIAAALDAAHTQGIVHRDLKPDNVMLTPQGTVKVLDFGIGKIRGPNEPSEGKAGATTVVGETRLGTVLGTTAYMSPEQARGLPVDKRTDIWAFGCVLYELLTGRAPFEGATATDTLAAVLEHEPDWRPLPAAVPGEIRRLLRRCLQKDPHQRLRDSGDIRIQLEDALAAPEPGAVTAGDAARGRAVRAALWATVGLLVGGIATAFALRLGGTPPPNEVTRFSVALPVHFELDTIALSPDGQTLVYGGNDHGRARLYRRALGSLEPEPILGTEGGRRPFFSPDGTAIGFWVDRTLKSVTLEGGIARTLYEAPGLPQYATWVSENEIVFNTNNSGLALLSLGSGTARAVTELDAEREAEHRAPLAVPGRRAVLFTGHYGGQNAQGVQVLSLETGARRELIEGNGARFVPPGHLLFQRGGSLWVAPFDAQRLELVGPPVEAIQGVAINPNWQPIVAVENGTIAYARGGDPYPPRALVWLDEAGRETPIDAPARAWWWPQVSPDGRQLGLHIMDPVNMDAWIYELDHGPLIRVTYHALQDGNPVWSPDGTRFAYWSRQAGGSQNIYVRAGDLAGEDRRVTASDVPTVPVGWTPDGTRIVFQQDSPETGTDIGVVAVDGASPAELLIAERANEGKPAISPDSRWIAYESDVSGRWDVYVQPFPELGPRWQVSADGGTAPLWSGDGAALYYRRGNAVLKVPIDTARGTFRHGNPEVLFDGDYVPEGHDVSDVPAYALARDTGRFLMMKQEPVTPREIVVIANWTSEIDRPRR